MDIKDILERLVTDAGVSVEELAEETGLSTHPIYTILSGKTRRPRRKTVKVLADYFGIKPSQLIGEEPIEHEGGGAKGKVFRIVTFNDMIMAELIVTLRAGFGMEPGSYNAKTSELTVPEDYAVKKKGKAEK